MKSVRIAMLGSGFVADFYMQGLADVRHQEVVVNYSRSATRAEAFARKWAIPESSTNMRRVDCARRSGSLHHRAAQRGAFANRLEAGQCATKSSLYQAPGAQWSRGPADARCC